MTRVEKRVGACTKRVEPCPDHHDCGVCDAYLNQCVRDAQASPAPATGELEGLREHVEVVRQDCRIAEQNRFHKGHWTVTGYIYKMIADQLDKALDTPAALSRRPAPSADAGAAMERLTVLHATTDPEHDDGLCEAIETVLAALAGTRALSAPVADMRAVDWVRATVGSEAANALQEELYQQRISQRAPFLLATPNSQ